MSELVLIEQRPAAEKGVPWILEGGELVVGRENGRRLTELRRGLMSHPDVRRCATDVDDEEVERTLGQLHDQDYLDALRGVCTDEPVLMPELAPPGLAPDTPVLEEVVATAHEGVRTAVAAARRLLEGARFTYALCRPPGHHAGPGWLAGYCYLNTAAVAAQTLCNDRVGRIGILDLDLHYPNGTAAIVAGMPQVGLHSLHAWPVTNLPSSTAPPAGRRERVVQFARAPDAETYLRELASSIEQLAKSTTRWCSRSAMTRSRAIRMVVGTSGPRSSPTSVAWLPARSCRRA